MKTNVSRFTAVLAAALLVGFVATSAHAVTVTTAVSGPGTVTPVPTAPATVTSGKTVTLKAKPDKDAFFAYWKGGGKTFYTATIKVAPTVNTTYTATFHTKAECAGKLTGIFSDTIPTIMVGVGLNVQFYVADAARPVKFTATGLPPGVKIDSASGLVSGTPTKAGTYSGATVKATSVANPSESFSVTAPPLTVVALPWNASGTFNGSVWDSTSGGAYVGSLTATVSATGKISAKATTKDGAFSFSAPSFSSISGNTLSADMKTAKGQTLVLTLNTAALWTASQLTGSFNGAYSVTTQRNPFINPNDPSRNDALAALANYANTYYTLSLQFNGLVPGTVSTAPTGGIGGGYSYLTFTVSNNGAIKLSGRVSDGSAVSASTTLLMANSGNANVRSFLPLYSKRGFLSGYLVLSPEGTLSGTNWRWHYPGKTPTAKTPATEDRFRMNLTPRGGRYDQSVSLWEKYNGKGFDFFDWPKVPFVQGANGSVMLSPAKKPVWDKVTGMYGYALNNPNAVTLTGNAKTGVFSGKIHSYTYDASGKITKATPLNYYGVLIQQAGNFTGAGATLDPRPWTDPVTQVKYILKQSRPVTVDVAPMIL